MKISLLNRRAFIGGSSQGIGWAIAQKMAECGATVTLTGRYAEKLQLALKNLPTPNGQEHDYIAIDFSDVKKLENVLPQYLEKTTDMPVAILVLNSGGPVPNSAYQATPPSVSGLFQCGDFGKSSIGTGFCTGYASPKMGTYHHYRLINREATAY